MFLEGITVSVNYSDYLDVSLTYAKPHFDRIIVVTHAKDKKTIRVCKKHKVKFVTSERFYLYGSSFNKGGAINDGLSALERRGWIIHFDSDVIFPPNMRKILEGMKKDLDVIYGCDRTDVKNQKEFEKALRKDFGKTNWTGQSLVGRAPYAGYFQMFSAKAPCLNQKSRKYVEFWYPDWPTAYFSDTLFCLKWPKQGSISKLRVIHLGVQMVNWEGRKTKLNEFRVPSKLAGV